MSIDYAYFRFWNRITRAGDEPLTHEQAQALHLKDQSYAVVVTENGRAIAIIEVASDFYGVSFLDESGHQELRYSFQRIETGQLFLSEVLTRESGYWFKRTGWVHGERLLASGKRGRFETSSDLSTNYEVEPAFGDYARLLVRERGSMEPVMNGGSSNTVEMAEYWSGFDWERKRPKGRRLGDRAVMNARRDGRTYYVIHVREEYAGVSELADELVRRVLTWVEEHDEADKVSRCERMSIELPLPRKKPAVVHSDDPDFF